MVLRTKVARQNGEVYGLLIESSKITGPDWQTKQYTGKVPFPNATAS